MPSSFRKQSGDPRGRMEEEVDCETESSIVATHSKKYDTVEAHEGVVNNSCYVCLRLALASSASISSSITVTRCITAGIKFLGTSTWS